MPQMMPLNWLWLFMLFSMLLMLFNVMNYYMPFNKNNYMLPIKTIMKKLNWKW